MKKITRREFLAKSGKVAATIAAFGGPIILGKSSISSASAIEKTNNLESMLQLLVNTAERGRWDPIYGADLVNNPKYGGRSDFKGHKFGGAGEWGIDYGLPSGTPLVPTNSSYFLLNKEVVNGGEIALLSSSVKGPGLPPAYSYQFMYQHLSEVFVGKKGKSYPPYGSDGIVLAENTIFALSGATGSADFTRRNPHLHFGLYSIHFKTKKKKPRYGPQDIEREFLDPEKYGPNKGRPIYWDGKTNLSIPKEERVAKLEQTLAEGSFEELLKWPQGNHEMDELRGNIFEYYNLIGGVKGTEILDSTPFQNMRDLLIREILEAPLEERKAYVPGTMPYSLMLKIVGYSSIDQNIVILLPYPSPDLARSQLDGKLHLYKVTVDKK